MASASDRLREPLEGGPLAGRLETAAEPFLTRRGKDAALARLDGAALRGLARVLASNPEAARWLSHRPIVLERLAAQGDPARAPQDDDGPAPKSDLEGFLDRLRIDRRDAECLYACLDLGGALDFEQVSRQLSLTAERTLQRALDAALALSGVEVSGAHPGGGLAVVGMGKIAGRELTYHSDLDLIFVCDEARSDVPRSSRVAQRLIGYLSTMTGAGRAYAIDARLRPSGRQGTLVTTLEAFESYQRERAATWEHLALMRSRTVAGAAAAAEPVLARTRSAVAGRGGAIWTEVTDMRARVEAERGRPAAGEIALKAGAGGTMELEFLATGGMLESGAELAPERLPAIPEMLRAAAPEAAANALVPHYALLRRVEARARWSAGRAVETLRTDPESLALIADLVEPGWTAERLSERVDAARGAIRAAWERVSTAGSIRSL
jgi:glutamate-ammonia-ligase adenylyltransferase